MKQPADDSRALTALEKSVLEAAMRNAGIGAGFREQIDVATVTGRTPSGVGFMTRLHVPERYRVADTDVGNMLPVVTGEHPELPSGAEFVLQIRDGRISCIEGFCHEGMWPADESTFRIEGPRRPS